MRLVRIAHHLCEALLRYGPGAVAHDIGYRAINTLADLQILKGMTAQLNDVRDPNLFKAPEFEGRFVSPDELAQISEARHGLSAEFLRSAKGRGDRCYALFHGDALASFGWYTEMPTPIDQHFVLHFDPAYTYMFNGYTLPAYRGMRLHAVGMCRALREFTEQGKKGLISYVESNNFASLRSVARMGYRIFGSVLALRVAGHSFTHASPGCAEYAFRLEPSSSDSSSIFGKTSVSA
jgi:hypothetical protein